MRAIDAYPERTADAVHFGRAASEKRVYLANDSDIPSIAREWLAAGRPFRGLIYWRRSLYRSMSPGDFVRALDRLAQADDPFRAYPIIYLKLHR